MASLMFLLVKGTEAFVPTVVPLHRQGVSSPAVRALPQADLLWSNSEFLEFSQNIPSTASLSSSTLVVSSAVEIIQTIAIVLGSIIALLFVLSLLTAKFLLPQAAKQLEEQTRDKYPDLWQEALSRLEPGETLESRPDLIQEYGNKLQDRMTADFVAQQQAVQEKKKDSTAASMADAAGSWASSEDDEKTSQRPPKTKDIVDVEFTKDEGTKSS